MSPAWKPVSCPVSQDFRKKACLVTSLEIEVRCLSLSQFPEDNYSVLKALKIFFSESKTSPCYEQTSGWVFKFQVWLPLKSECITLSDANDLVPLSTFPRLFFQVILSRQKTPNLPRTHFWSPRCSRITDTRQFYCRRTWRLIDWKNWITEF